MKRIKLGILFVFVVFGTFTALVTSDRFVQKVRSYAAAPPAAKTGAPGERTCSECHTIGRADEIGSKPMDLLDITAPATYSPGATYTILVTHTAIDSNRRRWGFQMTALNENAQPAGTFANLSPTTQIVGQGGRTYIEQTGEGTFSGQGGGAQWNFKWTAPGENVGTITLYAAGNQANNDGTETGDFITTARATLTFAGPAATPTPTPAASPTPTPTPTPVATPTPTPPQNAKKPLFDFDADGKADVAVFRPSTGDWYINRSKDGFYGQNFGSNTDRLSPADYDGDGKTDVAVYRPSTGVFFIYRSSDGGDGSAYWGLPEDIPAVGDFDGDGKADVTIFRPSTGTFWIRQSGSGNAPLAVQYGANGDQPVTADYDGDGKTDIAVYRPSTGVWYIHLSKTGGDTAVQFGIPSDKAVPGDFDGDGKADVAVYRTETGVWFIVNSTGGYTSYQFGYPTDTPAPADYDGDGKIDMTIFRPGENNFWINGTKAGVTVIGWGNSTDRPLANAYVR